MSLDKEVFKIANSISPQEHIKGRRGKFHLVKLINNFSSDPSKFQVKKMGMNINEKVIIKKLIDDLGKVSNWYIYKNKLISIDLIKKASKDSPFLSNKKIILILNTEVWCRSFLK